jgi:hypothetical protein
MSGKFNIIATIIIIITIIYNILAAAEKQYFI